MYILSINMWFQRLMRQFFFNIDKIVFNFIPTIYDLLMSIARTSILSQADIIDMADRIYKLLAVFMVFKVTFSLIMYVVNPDDFSDKSKGVGKLISNIVISLSLLILTPYIFRGAYELQTIILEDNAIYTVIFGGTDEKEKSKNTFLSAGELMSFTTMSPFFTPNLSISGLEDCSRLTNADGKFNKKCSDAFDELTKENANFKPETKNNFVAGVENGSLGLMFRQNAATATDKDDDNFIFDYKYIFSTVIGVVVVLLLISFCLDIALRSIKLSFLELVAPIPILSYVDPKGGKDGMFKKWYQMCLKTYLSLFIRLFTIYFAVYIIGKVDRMSDIIDGSYVSNLYIKIFVIIGALMFAKQLPKILEGLGIKLDDGKFMLNPLRKIENEALGGKILKKPNDMLAKFGKGVALAPLNGASLLAKKTIGGIDAAKNGKGFAQGWNRTHGKLYNSFYKKLDEWAPDSAEDRKNERLGREELHQMSTKWQKGEAIASKLRANGKSWDDLVGRDTDAYAVAGFSGEFLRSKMNVDYQSERGKLLQNLYNSASMQGFDKAMAEARNDKNIEKYKAYGIDLDKIKEATDLSKENAKQQKVSAGAEKVHESMRKQFQTQASIEDQIKFVKDNRADPTDPTGERKSIFHPDNINSTSNGGPTGNQNSSTQGATSRQTNNEQVNPQIRLNQLVNDAQLYASTLNSSSDDEAKAIVKALIDAINSLNIQELEAAISAAEEYRQNH